jgi:hypothetical protein
MTTRFGDHVLAVASAAAALDAALAAAADAVLEGDYPTPGFDAEQMLAGQLRFADDVEVLRYNLVGYSLPRVLENLSWLARLTCPGPDAAAGYEQIPATPEEAQP